MDNLAMVRLPFRAGRNTLVLRSDADNMSHSAWLRICVRGRPRPPDEVKASQEAIAKAGGPVPLSPRFWTSDDPVAERKRWIDFVSRHRTWFEKTIELAPESDEAKRSRAVIGRLR